MLLAAGVTAPLAVLAVATGTSSATTSAPSTLSGCNVDGTWSGPFNGSPQKNDVGSVTFEITNQQSTDNDNAQGNNNNQGDVSTFRWQTLAVTNGVMNAQGTGSLAMTSATSAQFFISGQGTHPTNGPFSVQARGTLDCVAGIGENANGNFNLQFANGMTDHGTVGPLANITCNTECFGP
jgi:hypothetical protein